MSHAISITRKEAKARGLKRYFTGEPCCNGHIEERLVSNFACVVCHVAKVNRWRAENPDKASAAYAVWYALNRKDKNRKGRQWIRDNPERHSQNAKDWRALNPDKVRVYDVGKRARKKNAAGFHTAKDIERQRKVQGNRCLCGVRFSKKVPYTVDHITPLARGGSNWPDNIQLLCGTCNSSKGSKTMSEWRQMCAA